MGTLKTGLRAGNVAKAASAAGGGDNQYPAISPVDGRYASVTAPLSPPWFPIGPGLLDVIDLRRNGEG